MKTIKAGLIILLLGSLFVLTLSCSSANPPTTAAGAATATVKNGSILTSVIGTGNLALKTKQALSFGETGLVSEQTTVKIAEVNVFEGQIVEEGQILVKADTKDWQNKISTAQHTLDSKKASLLQAQANLESAQYNLEAQEDVKTYQDKIDNSKKQLEQARVMLNEASHFSDSEGVSYWVREISNIDNRTIQYQKDLDDLLADPIHSGAATSGGVSSVADLKAKQRAVEQAKAQVVNAQNDLDEAQTALDDAKTSNQEIKAPFKGLITRIDLSGADISVGDIVERSKDIIEIAKPDEFVADILVTEIDVMNLFINENATVTFNALTGLSFPAKVTKIAPLATVTQGVVNYSITVELASTTPLAQRLNPSLNSAQNPSNSNLLGAKSTGPSDSGNHIPTNIYLKDGLSATVTIIIQEKNNVLIIPNRSITRSNGVSTVQVVNGANPEIRTITTGLSDSSNTEVTDGLKEGDQITVKTNAANSQFGGVFRMP